MWKLIGHTTKLTLTGIGVCRGNPAWVDMFVPSMQERGKELGVNMCFDTYVGNSMDSLRLLHWCRKSHPELQEVKCSLVY